MQLNKENVLAHYKKSWSQHKTAEFFWVSTTKIRSLIWSVYKDKPLKVSNALILKIYKELWSIDKTVIKLWLTNYEVINTLWGFRVSRIWEKNGKYVLLPRDYETQKKLKEFKKKNSSPDKLKIDEEFEAQIRRNNEINEKWSNFYWFKKYLWRY